ncbi:purine-nucleoside phosphorylase [Clostridium sp. 'deep sea']|uniref:purine-nucleoside phosphorylase n=1 Tax=Clostridium sp. 'deep sea' TaxID=2779445 RepID=UPI001896A4A7|nr:purine-nucleoside phosphorylase [Clostridium sp. 'deep sea']QOR34009.1 purine-nucleoside phosphorylase [Clostridium sp. 'deep sea']
MTVHINAKKGDIAKTVLLPGDPLRAKYIAETFLEDVVCYNTVRNMLGFTGTWNGKRVSVQGTGMGMPSIGIYSHELIAEYGVEQLIRVGSCGSFQKHVGIRDVILGISASTNSRYASQYGLPGTYAPTASYELVEKAKAAADKQGIPVHVGNILSSDIFYDADPNAWEKWARMGVLAVEMEAAALYMNAAYLGAKALAILTVSDSLVTHELTTSEERQKTFKEMITIALDLA